jgi:uncharacterized membrane protein YebE (DUF533 family)
VIIKLAALGALGYAGYRYLQKSQAGNQQGTPPVALAGGPLSSQATIQSDPNVPPATS